MSAAATAELIEDRGEAAVSDDFFRSRPFLDAEAVTHTLRIETGDGRAAGAPDRPRDRRRPPSATPISPYGYPGLAPCHRVGASELLAPGAGQVRPTPSIPPRSTSPPPAWSASSSATASARRRSPGPPSATSSRSPTRRCRRRAGPATAARSAGTSRRATSWRSSPALETTPAQRAGFLDVYEQTMRRTDAAEHYFFGAAYFDRVLAAERTWLALATAPGRRPRRRLARRRQRRLPPLLPLRQRRLPPPRLADEERRRPPDRALRRAAASPSTSAAASPPATPWRSSSAASPTAKSPGTPPRSSATRRRTQRLKRRPRPRGPSSPPTGPPAD